MIAFAALLLLRLAHGDPPRGLAVLGNVMLTLLSLWAYLQFLPFFISWSGNLPPAVRWYAARSGEGWAAATWAFAILGGLPLLLTITWPAARREPRWLMTSAGLVLAGKLIEIGWFALPGEGASAVLGYACACMALATIAAATLRIAFAARLRARAPATRH